MNNVTTYVPERTYQPKYQVFVPNGGWGGDAKVEPVPAWYWWLCRLKFWRFRVNRYWGFLVEVNRWTRAYHFTNEWDAERNSFADAKDTLSFIAMGGRRKDGRWSMIPVFLLPLVWLPGFIVTFHATKANLLDVSTAILMAINFFWFIWRGLNKMLESI